MNRLNVLDRAIEQYQLVKRLNLKGEVRDQANRAALSVCLNLSEGNAKSTSKAKRNFFNIAYASQQELRTLLLIENINRLYNKADQIGAMIYKLQKSL